MRDSSQPWLATAGLGKWLRDLAEWTGLEPATPGVTGRYSNQLNYHSFCCCNALTSGGC